MLLRGSITFILAIAVMFAGAYTQISCTEKNKTTETTKKIKQPNERNLLYSPVKGLKCQLYEKMTYREKIIIGQPAPVNNRYDLVLSQMFMFTNKTKTYYKFTYGCRIAQGPNRHAEIMEKTEHLVGPEVESAGAMLQLNYSAARRVGKPQEYKYLCTCSATEVQEPVGILVMPYEPTGYKFIGER